MGNYFQKSFRPDIIDRDISKVIASDASYAPIADGDILEEKDKYSIYIKKDDVVIPWKDFNKNMAVSIEYNIDY